MNITFRHSTTLLALITAAILALICSSSSAKDRPNILWISCEDISPHLGCYGDPQATTPVLDQLAKDAAVAKAQLLSHLEDGSPSVRIAAARALCEIGMEEKALPVLIEELGSDREWVRLNAAIVLDSIGDKARLAAPALKETLKDKQNKYVVRVANHALNVMLGTSNVVR